MASGTIDVPRNWIVQTVMVYLQHNVTTDITWPKAFPHACVSAIAQSAQAGFASPGTISVSDTTASGCKVHQVNTASAVLGVLVTAIGY